VYVAVVDAVVTLVCMYGERKKLSEAGPAANQLLVVLVRAAKLGGQPGIEDDTVGEPVEKKVSGCPTVRVPSDVVTMVPPAEIEFTTAGALSVVN